MGSMTGKKPLIILGIIFILLLLSVLWSMNKVGGYVGTLSVPRAFLCKEIKKGVTPIPLTEKLYPDQKQVCVWFEYEHATKGDKVKISCYRDNEAITEEYIVLTAKKGVRAFYLVKIDGTGLPVGKYKIILSSATKEWHTLRFEVIRKPIVVEKKQDKKTKAGGAKIAKNKKSYAKQQRRSNRRKRR